VGWSTVSAGGLHTCGVQTNDTLACWGDNSSGQATLPVGTFGLPSDGDDGILDEGDQCLVTSAGETVDADGCAIPDLCPCDHPWKTHGACVSCVAQTAEDCVAAGLITAEVVGSTDCPRSRLDKKGEKMDTCIVSLISLSATLGCLALALGLFVLQPPASR
jgi:Regulator of chromosome condensation (RCC1) repeat